MTVLSLSGCSKITDDGVEVLSENLRQLKSLDLSWCSRITDASLEYIACDLCLLEELTLDRYDLTIGSDDDDDEGGDDDDSDSSDNHDNFNCLGNVVPLELS